MPKVSEQAAIGRRVVAIESVHENLRFNLRKLALTKTGLMQDLLTGKVPVKADEPEEITPSHLRKPTKASGWASALRVVRIGEPHDDHFSSL